MRKNLKKVLIVILIVLMSNIFSASIRYFKEKDAKLHKTGEVNTEVVATVGIDKRNTNTSQAKTGWDSITEQDPETGEEVVKWIYIKEDGTRVTGWEELDYGGKISWYFFNEYGVMHTGWYQDTTDGLWYYLNPEKNDKYAMGELVKGWVEIEGKEETKRWYYLAENEDKEKGIKEGQMLKGWQEIADKEGIKRWYYLAEIGDKVAGIEEGQMLKGWQELEYKGVKYWFYLAENEMAGFKEGELLTGWQTLEYDGKLYKFYLQEEKDNNYCKGAMVTGWITLDGATYYLKEEKDNKYCKGAMVTGWITFSGTKQGDYYFAEKDYDDEGIKKGQMLKNKWYKLPDKDNNANTKVYHFGADGKMEKEYNGPSDINITANPNDKWVKGKITLIINSVEIPNGIGLHEKPYSFDGGKTWTSENKKTFEENQKVVIKVKDKFEFIFTKEFEIKNIQKLDSISIEKKPTKTNYYVGDDLDLSGIQVMAIYNVGEKEEIKSGYEWNPKKLTSIGTQTILITYEGKQASFEVKVLEVPKEITLESSLYEIQNDKKIIAKIQPNTKISEFKKKITTNSEEIKLLDAQNSPCGDTETVKTGMKLKIDNNLIYTLIVTGDVNGDSKTDITDMDLINKCRLKEQSLDGVYLLAADVNGDAKVDLKDLMKINKYRLEKIDSL